jgi:hypothetical protein
LEIDEFQEMQADGNESMPSEDNRRDLEEFNDLQSDKMG